MLKTKKNNNKQGSVIVIEQQSLFRNQEIIRYLLDTDLIKFKNIKDRKTLKNKKYNLKHQRH